MNILPPRIRRAVLRPLRVVAFAVALLAVYVLMRVGVTGLTRTLMGT